MENSRVSEQLEHGLFACNSCLFLSTVPLFSISEFSSTLTFTNSIMPTLWSSSFLAFASLASFLNGTVAEEEEEGCAPYQWENPDAAPNVVSYSRPKITQSPRKHLRPQAGDIHCRYWTETYAEVSPDSCSRLAQTHQITLEKFWMLNPELAPSCEGIAPYTEYCVAGCESSTPSCSMTFNNMLT